MYSVIGERVPLELLTHRPVSPPQLAEIQVLLSSRAVVSFAFIFCHLVHWVAFGQTRRDRSHNSQPTVIDECQCTTTSDSTPATAGIIGANHPATTELGNSDVAMDSLRNSRFGLSRELRVLKRGQELLRKGMTALAAKQGTTASEEVARSSPEKLLKDELLRLRGRGADRMNNPASGGETIRANGAGLFQGVTEQWTGGGVQDLEDCGGLEIPLDTCARRLKALAMAETAYKQITEKIKVRHGMPPQHTSEYF